MKKKIRLITGFGRHMSKSNVNAFASSSAYFMFLSIIPIIILLCSLLPLTTLQKSDLLKAVSEVMPSPIVPMMSSLIESLYNSTVGVTSVAAIVTVWSASKGMLSIMRGLNAMNGVVEDRNYFVQRILASFYTIDRPFALSRFHGLWNNAGTSFKRQDHDTGSSDVHSDAF